MTQIGALPLSANLTSKFKKKNAETAPYIGAIWGEFSEQH